MNRSDRLKRKIKYNLSVILALGLLAASVSACSDGGGASSSGGGAPQSSGQAASSKSYDGGSSQGAAASSEEKTKGSRDNTPVVLVPEASGETVYENEYAHIDASHTSDGYVIVRYTGECPKVKLQITGPDSNTYTYDLSASAPKDEVFPLQAGNGEYMVNVFENVEGTNYVQALSQPISVTLTDEFSPFLYPNQYVEFTPGSPSVKMGSDLAYTCNSDLEVVSEVYNYIISNITYDHAAAETVQAGYIPNPDATLSSKTGICLDYAALMVTMLRTQKIPTRMEIGYAGTVYHAWISTYIKDVGWVNGMIEFDGADWSLMDPTFASNVSDQQLKKFIGDGSNYTVEFIY